MTQTIKRKQVAIIGGTTTDPERQTDYETSLRALAPEHDFVQIRFDYLVFHLEPGLFSIYDAEHGRELHEYDLVLFRGKVRAYSELAYAISRYCEVHAVTFRNDYSNCRPSSKLSQSVVFYEQQANFITTLHAINSEYLKVAVRQHLQYPVICKDQYGSHGDHNYLVEDETSLEGILTSNPDVRFVVQEFHKNEGDYRLLLVGDLKPLQIWRQALGESHLNNTSQGATASLVDDLDDTIVAQARRVADALKLSIAGADLLRSSNNDELYFLEVNAQPQLFTGACVSEKTALLKKYIDTLLTAAA